jgi:hypothetical protein
LIVPAETGTESSYLLQPRIGLDKTAHRVLPGSTYTTVGRVEASGNSLDKNSSTLLTLASGGNPRREILMEAIVWAGRSCGIADLQPAAPFYWAKCRLFDFCLRIPSAISIVKEALRSPLRPARQATTLTMDKRSAQVDK